MPPLILNPKFCFKGFSCESYNLKRSYLYGKESTCVFWERITLIQVTMANLPIYIYPCWRSIHGSKKDGEDTNEFLIQWQSFEKENACNEGEVEKKSVWCLRIGNLCNRNCTLLSNWWCRFSNDTLWHKVVAHRCVGDRGVNSLLSRGRSPDLGKWVPGQWTINFLGCRWKRK